MKLTVIGSSGSFGGPGNPCSSYLVEPTASGSCSTWQRRARRASTVRRLYDLARRDPAQPPARRPLRRHLRATTSPANTGPAGPRPVAAGVRARPARLSGSPRPTTPTTSSARRSSTSARAGGGPGARPATLRARPVHGHARPGCPPRRGLRVPARGPAAAPSSTPATPAPAALDPLATGADLLLSEASFERAARRGLPGLHLNGRQAGEQRDRRRRQPPGAHPHPAVDGRRAQPGRRKGRFRRPGGPGHAGRGVPDLRP